MTDSDYGDDLLGLNSVN